MSENTNKKISLAGMKAKRNGIDKQNDIQVKTMGSPAESIKDVVVEKEDALKKPKLKIGISLKNSEKKMLSVDEETITPIDNSEITNEEQTFPLKENEGVIPDTSKIDNKVDAPELKKISLSGMQKTSKQDISEDVQENKPNNTSQKNVSDDGKNLVTTTDTEKEIILTDNKNALLTETESIEESNNMTGVEHTTKTGVHVVENKHVGEDEKIVNTEASEKFGQLFNETNIASIDSNNDDEKTGEHNEDSMIMLGDEVLLGKPKSLFSNYESDFSAKESDIMSKIKKLKYLPKTRPALICSLIAITGLGITGLFYLDPKKHSLNNYKATLISYYKSQTGEEDLERIQEGLNSLQEKQGGNTEKLPVTKTKKFIWNKEEIVHKGFSFKIESRIGEDSVKVFQYNGVTYTKLGGLQKVLDTEISKLKHNKVEKFSFVK